MSPEYAMDGLFSAKSDVFSFRCFGFARLYVGKEQAVFIVHTANLTFLTCSIIRLQFICSSLPFLKIRNLFIQRTFELATCRCGGSGRMGGTGGVRFIVKPQQCHTLILDIASEGVLLKPILRQANKMNRSLSSLASVPLCPLVSRLSQSLSPSKGRVFPLGKGSSSNRYLGIWYHKVPEKTVVWVANRNDPIIGSSGFLFINQHGNLVLYGNDDQKLPVWSTNVSVEENDSCEAQLLDSGNLIMVTKRSRYMQSFDHPTNTLLPGMKLGVDRKLGIDRFLTSWRSADDPGIGDFSVRINPKGSPQFFCYNGTKTIARSTPWPWKERWAYTNALLLMNRTNYTGSTQYLMILIC
uniref:Bulb-type lectin domain-containing protein n=1 Tax=Salix viminalis TaxID=40686 RepID=A0A6N2N4N8_SALVM